MKIIFSFKLHSISRGVARPRPDRARAWANMLCAWVMKFVRIDNALSEKKNSATTVFPIIMIVNELLPQTATHHGVPKSIILF